MQNFIFISPNFPTNYWQFCHELKNNGMNVLGIGDQPYDELKPELKDSLNEYYKVGSLENYDEVYRAVAFFAFKYGRIDWLESNNEYWLERERSIQEISGQIQDYALPFFARFSNLPKLLDDVEQEGFFPHRKGFDVPKRNREFIECFREYLQKQ